MRSFRFIAILATLAGGVVTGGIVTGILALLVSPGVAADASAQAFLQQLYRPYEKSDKGLDFRSEAKAARYFVPTVAKLIGRDVAQSAKRNEVGRLDFDPFIAGQDWTPTRIALEVAAGATPDRAVGTARFTPPGEKKPMVVTLDLAKTADGWRIADIHWSGQSDSLVATLERKD
jgi:uncharacterized protein DUF3828